jgi:hypothetical protein
MSSLLVENFEGTVFSEMSIATGRNRRRQHRAAILQEICRLFLQIDLDRSGRLLPENRYERQEQNRYSRPDFLQYPHNLV